MYKGLIYNIMIINNLNLTYAFKHNFRVVNNSRIKPRGVVVTEHIELTI